MSAILGHLASIPVEEVRTALATIISRLLELLRILTIYALEISKKIYSYMSEHPLGIALAIANIAILLS